MGARGRSKSARAKQTKVEGDKNKNKNKGKPKESGATLSPFVDSPQKSAPWKPGTPSTRLPVDLVSEEQDKETVKAAGQQMVIPGGATASTEGDAEVLQPEVKDRFTELLHLMGDSAPETLKMEVQKFLAPESCKKLRHQDLSKADKLERQIAAARKEVDLLDSRWREFVTLIQTKFEHQRQGYIQQRETQLQTLDKR